VLLKVNGPAGVFLLENRGSGIRSVGAILSAFQNGKIFSLFTSQLFLQLEKVHMNSSRVEDLAME
jgi:hypothetical protein